MRLNLFLAAALAWIAVATLLPGAAGTSNSAACVICGSRGVADALLNLTLFVPLGTMLAWRGVRAGRVLLTGFVISLLIELAQQLIPGRDPSAGDLLFNTAGALMGTTVPGLLSFWTRAVVQWRVRTSLLSLFLALSIPAITGILLRPDLPRVHYFGQWTPEFGNRERYPGHVLSATIGTRPIEDGPIAASARTRALLLSGAPLDLYVQAQAAPSAEASVFNLYDDRQREILSVMVTGADVLIRYRMQASRFRLDQPTYRVRGALRDLPVTGRWRFRMRLLPGGMCVRVQGVRACPLGFSVARGWSVLLHSPAIQSFERVIDLLWLCFLLLPVGVATPRARIIPALALAIAAALIMINSLIGLQALRPSDFAGAVAGLLIGHLIRRHLPRELLERTAGSRAPAVLQRADRVGEVPASD